MRTAVYARFSSDNQRSESIDAQVRACEEYAKKNGLSIVIIYSDEALSGTTDKRPQFQKMIKDSEYAIFDAVVVHKLDRFARDKYDAVVYKRKLRNAGIRLYSVTENIDGSPESIILESVIEGMAQYYSENLAREVMKGLTENALKCKHTGGKPPFGYDVDKELNYVINEYEAIAVKQIFKDYANGVNHKEIIKWLTDNGYRTKYGNYFQKSSLNILLKNKKYIGVYVYNEYKRIKQGEVKINKKNAENDIVYIENGIPAIITKELFGLAQRQLKTNKETSQSVRAKEQYLLSNKFYCGFCGGKMNGGSRLGGRNKVLYVTYSCSNRRKNKTCNQKEISRTFIDSVVLEHLQNVVFTDRFISDTADKVFKQYTEMVSNVSENTKLLEDKLKQVRMHIDNIIEAITNGMFHESMKNKMDALESQKNELISQIATEKSKKGIKFTQKDVKAFMQIGKNLQDKGFKEQKTIIDTFISKIELFDDEIVITLKLAPTTPDVSTVDGAFQSKVK